jgi:biopolymer transport protein ExbD
MRAYLQSEAQPMMEINTTPLIDVMLVLLIMFIITIPLQSHAVKVDLPGDGPVVVNPIQNTLVITTGGGLLWNNQAISDGQLRSTLAASQVMTRIPELHLKPEAQARYERVDEVLAMTKRAHVTRMGFVGNEAYQRF